MVLFSGHIKKIEDFYFFPFVTPVMSQMSESAERLPSVSSVSSISLVEIKAETHLVMKAFLERTLSTPQKERPGNVGGSYNDHDKYR